MRVMASDPWKTKLITCGIRAIISEVISQIISQKGKEKKEYSLSRVIHKIIYALLISTPVSSIFYTYLGKFVTAEGFKGILIKLIIDQTLYASLVNFLYLYVLELL